MLVFIRLRVSGDHRWMLDLSRTPEEIPDLYRMITKEALMLVQGLEKGTSLIQFLKKPFLLRFFEWVTRGSQDWPCMISNCGFEAYRLKCGGRIFKSRRDAHRYIPLLPNGMDIGKLEERCSAQAENMAIRIWGIERFLNGFLDLISVSFVHRYKKNQCISSGF